MMKLFVALALSAAMPSAHAMGKYNSCEDSAKCFTLDIDALIPTDTCQEAREEKTTPGGTDVAVYPRWITLGEPNLGTVEQAGPITDPLFCWDECVAQHPNDVVVQATLNKKLGGGTCSCGNAPSDIVFEADFNPDPQTTTVFSCDSTQYKACRDSTQCITATPGGEVLTDACQSVREEATTAKGADVALYPQWVPVSEAAGPSLEAGIGLPLGVQLDDPLACWDGCVAHLITELVDDTDVPFINEFLEGFEILAATLVANLDPEFDDCYCLTSNEDLDGIAALEDIIGSDEPVKGLDITTVVSCDAGESAGHSGGRKLETTTGRSLAQGLGWLLKKQ